VNSLLRAHRGETGIVESTYLHLGGIPGGDDLQKELDGLPYFSPQTLLGVSFIATFMYLQSKPDGASKLLPLGNLTDFEKGVLEKAKVELRKHISRGIEFAHRS